MSARRITFYLSLAFLLLVLVGIPIKSQFFVQTNGGLTAGRNVNMVSGTKLPLGDPWLQRQNEPSMAVSSRNPMHLLAAANDYRTIDMPDNYNLPGVPGLSAVRDSWIGVFESFNGGESSVSTLLPAFPQDTSNEGLLSPIHGFDTACDPIVRAGANGLFYLSGIAFNRSQQAGAVFVARYVDNNDREKVEMETDAVSGYQKLVGPIDYIDTKIVEAGNPGQFIDMPNMAVDVPRGSAPYGNVYLAYSVFLGDNTAYSRNKIIFVRSTNGGVTWGKPIKLSESQVIQQRPVIAIDPGDLTGKTVYVVFRRFSFFNAPGGIVLMKSTNGGLSFSKPREVAKVLYPFDQWTKGESVVTSFRTNSYPTMAVDGNGTVYVAWAQRYALDGLPNADGQARIVIIRSQDGGFTWTEPQFVDPYYEGYGHQFMPSMTCAGGKVTIIWYDQRDDIAKHSPNTKFIEDEWNGHRHTIDVRAAEAAAAGPLVFGESILVSRYLFFIQLNENGEPVLDGDLPRVWQGEFNFACLPLFWLGTSPFQGDYIEVVSSPQILPPPANTLNSWVFNTDPGEPTNSHGVWTDNRDVWPPGGNLYGDWITYNPPTSAQDGDFAQDNPCSNADTTGMRNQNIYTASLNHGVIVGSPGNTKQLDIEERAFVVFVKDTIGIINEEEVENRSFELTLEEIGGATASFDQFDDTVKILTISVPPYSSVSSTVYVKLSGSPFAPVRVNVREGGALVGYVILNPDSTNSPILDPESGYLGDEHHNPKMSNPKIWRYDVGNQNEPNAKFLSPRGQNPRGQNSGFINPRGQNTGYMNPRGQNTVPLNPRGQNENIVNSEMFNPRGQNFTVANTALTDLTWTASNDGNTTSAYSFSIVSEDPDALNNILDAGELIAQVLVYKVHSAPINDACALLQTHADELVVNVTNPRGQNPRGQNIAPSSWNAAALGRGATTQQEPDVPEITFHLAPGEKAEVVLRVYDPDTTDNIDIDTEIVDQVAGETAADAANTGDADPIVVTQPDPPWEPTSQFSEISISPASLSFYAVLGANPADQIISVWNSGSGTLNYTISDDADWLLVTPLSGTSHDYYEMNPHTVSVDIAGLNPGSYSGTITIADPYATNNPARVSVDLVVYTVPPPIFITTTSVPDGVRGTPYSTYLECSGGIGDATWSVSAGALPPGLSLLTTEGGTGWITGTPTAAGYFEFTVQAQDEYPQTATQALSMTIADWVAWYNGPGDAIDSGQAMAVDWLGNIYVTGTSFGSETGDDYATIKYNSSGVKQWVARYNGPGNGYDSAQAIAVDSSGNVYVTGQSTGSGLYGDYATIKYNAAGIEEWVQRYNGPGEGAGYGYDSAQAIAVDSSGNVYVTGTSSGWSSSFDFATVKYNSAGVEQWVARYDGPSNYPDHARAMVVDSSGNIYVTGISSAYGTGGDYTTVKYNSAGVEQWVARYNRSGDSSDEARAMAIDSSGNIYVTGLSSSIGTGNDYVTIKYDNSGVQQWVAIYDGPGNGQDEGYAIAVDSSANVYVTGTSAGSGTYQDYATIKYDGSGSEQWVARYNSPGGSQDDKALALAIDPLGNAYVTGYSLGNPNNDDCATIRYNSAGVEEWVARYNGPGNDDDSGQDVAMDPLGNVYVAGYSYRSESGTDYAAIRYTQSFPDELIISTETLDIGYVGVPYAATVWAFGGSGSRTWFLGEEAPLPPGMVLDGSTGIISGTPTTPETYNFSVQVLDGELVASKSLSITISKIVSPLDRFIISAPESGLSGTPFSVTITAKDAGGNTTTNVTGATALTVDSGPITPTSIPDTEFRDDGVWTGNVTLSAEGNRTITAANSGKTGYDLMRIWTLIISATDPNEGAIPDGKDFESIRLFRMNTNFKSVVKFYQNIALTYPFYVYADVDADLEPEIRITCTPSSYEARTYPAGVLIYVGTPSVIRDTYYMEFVWDSVFPTPPVRIWLWTHDSDGYDRMPDEEVIIVNF